MATWIAHLRIANNLIQELNIQNHIDFIVGNIGPDCGVPNEDWSKFDPPGEISHWRNKINNKIDYENFYSKFCVNNSSDFYLGYYVHLLTDDIWINIIYNSKKEKYKNELKKDPKFIWIMKEDWYDLDKLYLNKNNLYSYDVFKNIEVYENKYFDFFPENAFTRQIKYITNFYESRKRNIDRDFVYLNEKEMDYFVKKATEMIIEEINKKRLTPAST